jgi:rod shape-determining protein MreC
MKRKKKNKFPAKYVLLIMTIFCVVIITCSATLSISAGAANTVAGYIIVPMQKGVNQVGTYLSDLRDGLQLKKDLLAENEQLREELNEAQEELNQVQLKQEELDNLRELYDMDQTYSDYEKLAANVVGKDAGNWFSTFLIDRGSKEGVEVGMNVIADGGLAGIVTEVGPHYAKVRSIIDDNSKVSAKNLSTSDLCVISGSLKSMNESNLIDFSDLRDSEDAAVVGDQIVVSNISDMFLEGIPIGYITDISTDANNLTKSGHIATIVDFAHLDDVFVILGTKDITSNEEGE